MTDLTDPTARADAKRVLDLLFEADRLGWRTGLEALHAQIRDGEAYEGWALTCINDWRPDLSPFAQALAWEDFTDAVDKLAELRDPMFDPAGLDEDPEVAEHRYEERAEAFITTLMIPYAGPVSV